MKVRNRVPFNHEIDSYSLHCGSRKAHLLVDVFSNLIVSQMIHHQAEPSNSVSDSSTMGNVMFEARMRSCSACRVRDCIANINNVGA